MNRFGLVATVLVSIFGGIISNTNGQHLADNRGNKCRMTRHISNLIFFTMLAAMISLGIFSTVEAKSNTLSIQFTDFCCGYGKLGQKVTVTLKNTETNQKLGKHTFKFKTLDHCADGGSCKGKMNFDSKNSRSGDSILIDAEASGPSGGSDGEFFKFDATKHKYKVHVTLDEVGCGLKGFSCD